MQSFFTRLILISFVLVLLCFIGSAQLPDLIQESFDYPAGGDLEGQGDATGGWAGPWGYTAGTDVTVFDGTVPIVPLPCDTAGNYIEVTPDADMAIWRQLAEPMLDEGQTFWISVLYQRIEGDYDQTPEEQQSYNGLSLFNGGTELLYIGKPYYEMTLGVDAHNASGSVPLVDYDAYEGAWIVIKCAMEGTTANDTGYIFINPDPNVEPADTEADTSFAWVGSNGWDRFRIGCNNACWVAYDEIKVAQNYADLNKEPAGIFTSPVGNLPYEFALEQNYPNPFNPVTTISYNVPIHTEVNVTVYDMLGRKVATLVNEQQKAGTYQVVFDAAHLTSGVYLYQLQAGSFSATKKMILIR
jgi:hypothetical protein